jgi:iron-sulfur cluster repair protein YtfE (RIC family)
MDALELLKKDHETVDGLLKRIEDTTEKAVKTREELFARLKEELDLHAHVEETLLYPVLRGAEETREITLEAIEEHAAVKEMLAVLEATDKGTETWTAKFTVLKENVEHHVEEEEDDMFPSAKKVLDGEQRERLGRKIEEEKRKVRAGTVRAG